MTAARRGAPLVILGLSVLVVSTAAVMIRYAQLAGVPSLAIAFWRLGFATVVLSMVVLAKPRSRQELSKLPSSTWMALIFSGFFLALHFASWISSLAYTSVASSAALVTTNPIWIALISWLIFKERISGWLALGIATAMLGSLMIFLSDAANTGLSGSNPLLGNMLALVGSITVCGYLLIGQRIADKISLWLYVTLVYAIGAGFLGIFTIVSNVFIIRFHEPWLAMFGWFGFRPSTHWSHRYQLCS
ncbi:MAG: DMT family transporter [Gammaproteobacteria bacterium]|nr:DMT family transporter [Gammaproteobacteria bacterium]